MDAVADSAKDVGPDASPDVESDLGPDASPDVESDLGPDAAPDVESGLGPDVESDLGPDAAPDVPVSPSPLCSGAYGRPIDTGIIDDDRLGEVSGLAVSAHRPDLLWMHNDSGDGPRFFAVNVSGRRLAVLYVRGLEADDWEDLATARCPDDSGPCLWVADTGNNDLTRDRFVVYAVPEPVIAGDVALPDQSVVTFWRFPFTYPRPEAGGPGGPGGSTLDSEALAVAPDGSRFWVFEKVDGRNARVFGHPGPLVDGQDAVLEHQGTIASPGFAIPRGQMITGAALHPSGERLLLRVYTGTFEYRFAPGQSPSDLMGLVPLQVAAGPLSEPQGEAVAYDARGDGIYTVSEDPQMTKEVPIHHYDCLSARPPQ
ncbi:MAG: hypothetical protein EXR76_19450 [Myxococcales bacterium]|nr:hypothetical protein [Myxococcales bacterium]